MDPDLPQSSSKSRKVKFAPKLPPKRNKQNSVKPKVEEDGNEIADNEAAKAILRRVSERLTRQKPKAEKKVEVAFSHGVASPTSLKTFGKPREITVSRDTTGLKDPESNVKEDIDSSPPLPSTTGADLAEISIDNSDASVAKKKKEYKEPWDYYNSNYPTTLPWRRPYSGDPEILDEAEFGMDAESAQHDENTINRASELGLLEKKDDVQFLFLQFPGNLPLGKPEGSTGGVTLSPPTLKGKEVAGSAPRFPASAKGKEIADSSSASRRHNMSKKGCCSLEEMPEGKIGKMLVYKSGAVKLKIGDILYNVSPGQESYLSQNVAAINTAEKHICQLGEPGSKRAVVTPDEDFLLDKWRSTFNLENPAANGPL